MEPLKVLVCEDEEDIARQYQMILDELGHDVFLTKNGVECIKAFEYALTFLPEDRATPYDVVLVDYMMPEKNGLELTQEIIEKCPNQRVVIVTGHGPKLIEDLNNFDGQVEVLTKPISITSLVERIEKKRQKDIAKKMYSNLKKWKKSDGISNPTGPPRLVDNYRVIPD